MGYLRNSSTAATTADRACASAVAQADPANAVCSLVAVVAVTLISGFSYGYWVGAVIAGVFTGILCFALLQLCAALTRRQRKHLDNPKDEE